MLQDATKQQHIKEVCARGPYQGRPHPEVVSQFKLDSMDLFFALLLSFLVLLCFISVTFPNWQDLFRQFFPG